MAEAVDFFEIPEAQAIRRRDLTLGGESQRVHLLMRLPRGIDFAVTKIANYLVLRSVIVSDPTIFSNVRKPTRN
jgi:hypothetical protein